MCAKFHSNSPEALSSEGYQRSKEFIASRRDGLHNEAANKEAAIRKMPCGNEFMLHSYVYIDYVASRNNVYQEVKNKLKQAVKVVETEHSSIDRSTDSIEPEPEPQVPEFDTIIENPQDARRNKYVIVRPEKTKHRRMA